MAYVHDWESKLNWVSSSDFHKETLLFELQKKESFCWWTINTECEM